MPLARSWWLGKKKGKEAYVVPRVQDGCVEFAIGHDVGQAPTKDTDGTVRRTGAVCVGCGTAVPLAYIRSEGKAGRIGARLKWAHNEPFSADDTYRALDSMERLLIAAGAVEQAEELRRLRLDHQRAVYESETRKAVKAAAVASVPGAGLKPWREVITPQPDVASGQYNAAEFAADPHMVARGEGSREYVDPVEFFRRTYLTEGLRDLLSRAARRLSGDLNASPIVNPPINFGGGKTHSMSALYHLCSGRPITDFPQEVQELLTGLGLPAHGKTRRVTLVGTHIAPGSPSLKDDGTEVRTLWGELAWQLGGRAGYDVVAGSDRTATNPGAALAQVTQSTPGVRSSSTSGWPTPASCTTGRTCRPGRSTPSSPSRRR